MPEDESYLNKRGLTHFWENIDDIKQNKLTAGAGISITNDVISATGGGTADAVDWGHITGSMPNQTDLTTALNAKANTADLATVATSGSYNDLTNKPTIPTVNNATLTIQKNSTNVATFTANASSNVTANISVPTATSDLTNDSGFLSADTDCASGSSFQITGIGGAPLTLTELAGNATQNGTPTPDSPQPISVVTGENVVKIEGKNIFKFAQDSGSATRNGVTIAVDSYNRLTLNGTATGAFWCELVDPSRFLHGVDESSTNFRELDPDTWYSMSANILAGSFTAGTSFAPNFNIQIKDRNQSTNQRSCDFGASTAFNTADGIYRAWLYIKSGDVFNNCTLGFQLELGSTASQFEPYQGQEFEVNLGKNLFDLQASTRTDSDVVFTKTTDTITASGTTTRSVYAETCSIYDNFSGLGNYPAYATTSATNSFQLPAGTYTFSASITNNGNTTGGLNIGVGTLGARVSTSTKLEKTAGQSGTASATISVAEGQYVLLSVWYEGSANAKTVGLSISNIQLELGSTATAYAPYFTPIELAKIGNYQDRIYKEDSKWYIEKQVGKVVLDGSSDENWQNQTGSHTTILNLYSSMASWGIKAGTLPVLCSIASYSTNAGANNDTYANICKPNSAGRFFILDLAQSDFATFADFKTWLASNPTTVYYALATPSTTEITNEALIAQLNFIANLYEGANTVMLVGAGAQGEITVCHSDVSRVAITGSYNDLTDKPTIPTVNDATLTIQKNGSTVKTFTANASSNVTANITVPTQTSDLTNNSGFLTSSTGVTSVNGAHGAVTGIQTTSNLVTSVSSSSTNSQYPSAKLFYDTVGNIESVLQTLNSGTGV